MQDVQPFRQRLKGKCKHACDYECCAKCDARQRLYSKYSKDLLHFLAANVGKDADDAYSRYCYIISSESPRSKHWLKDAWKKHIVFNAQEVDGRVCYGKASQGVYYELPENTCYVLAGDKQLRCTSRKSKPVKEAASTKKVVSEALYFELEPVVHLRKVGSGQFVEVHDFCWFKYVSRKTIGSYPTWSRIGYENGKPVWKYVYVECVLNLKRKFTASKKEIKIFNLETNHKQIFQKE